MVFLLPVLLVVPSVHAAADLFPGYPDVIRTQAERVVAVAGPGKEEELEKEVRLLRIRMHARGILSVNALPDAVFSRAVREGWKKQVAASLRILRDVSPFSVPMWVWLIKEDVRKISFADFFEDVDGLSGSLRRFGPALVGCAAWVMSFLGAAACWFVVWASVTLFLRSRPSFEGDLARLLTVSHRDYLAVLAAALLFLLPILAGFGLAIIAGYWMLLSAGYLRKGELVIMTTGILVLAAILLFGGVLHSLRAMGDAKNGGWLGEEGTLAFFRQERSSGDEGPISGDAMSWMVRYARARSEMQSGRPAVAEKLWTDLVREGRDLPEVLNNRGIAKAQQGNIEGGLADFEAAVEKRPNDAPALWNTYQVHLQTFNLERARKIQPQAWELIQKMAPFHFRPAEMEQGEWVASALPVGEIWKGLFQLKGNWFRNARGSDFFRMFFHPLSVRAALVFLGLILVASTFWKLLSRKLWVNNTCRSCGGLSLVVRSREAYDICTPCRVKIGGGIRAGEERDRRVRTIVLHRRYVRIVSVLVPGTGALWAGKEIRTLIFGVALSVALAGVSASLGGERAGDALVSELQGVASLWSAVLVAVLWTAGALWGIRSFYILQRVHNIAGEKG
jgi:tetratricopeptide (TPR) repeat protein